MRHLTHADALAAWRVDGELRGGHTVQQTLGFVDALQDIEDDRSRAPLPGVCLADCEPKWLTRLNRWFGR